MLYTDFFPLPSISTQFFGNITKITMEGENNTLLSNLCEMYNCTNVQMYKE